MWNILTEIWYNFLKMSVYVSFLFCLFSFSTSRLSKEYSVKKQKAIEHSKIALV